MDLHDFPVHLKMSIAWGEMDALGHINNINYFRYFENARIQYLQEVGLMQMRNMTGTGTVLAETTCKYLKSLRFPDQIVVGARVKSMSQSSFVMEYLIVSEKLGEVAFGEGVLVMYNNKKSETELIPLAIREAIKEIEGNPNL